MSNTSDEVGHTPWKEGADFEIIDARGCVIADTAYFVDCTSEDARQVRSTILRAVNSHDSLVKALERFVRIRDWSHDESHSARLEYDAAADAARAALSQAKGGK